MTGAPMAPGSMPPTYERDGWLFEAKTCPLWGSERIDELARDERLCKVPDMFCGDAALRIRHRPSGTLIELSAADAMRCCSWRPVAPAPLQQPPRADGGDGQGSLLGTVRCQYADQWRPNTDNPDVKELEVTSDWTCSSPYWGSVYSVGEGGERSLLDGAERETDEELPMELLRRRDEIHWYNEVLFWEDELGDNGLCRMTARVRVMPSFWFVLLICELRVDNVIIREVGTRFFCRFGSDQVLREWTWKEASYDTLKGRGISLVDNPNISQSNIGVALLTPQDVQRRLRHVLPLCARPAAAAAEGGAGAGAEGAEET